MLRTITQPGVSLAAILEAEAPGERPTLGGEAAVGASSIAKATAKTAPTETAKPGPGFGVAGPTEGEGG